MPQWEELNYCFPWSNLKIATAWSDFNFSTPWLELNFSTSLSDPTSHHHGSTPNFNCVPQWQTTQLSAYIVQSQLLTDSFSKSSNSQDHRFQAWHHSHSSPISYLGFIMTIVIFIFFVHECKLYLMLCTWTKSQIVQSPTKLNDKI